MPDTERILITPSRQMVYSGMVPGWIEGHYQREELDIDLSALAAAAGTRFVLDAVVALDADRRRLSLASGASVDYDILSLAVGGALDLAPFATIDGLLPVRPMDAFVEGWSAMAQSWPERIAVVGGGAAGTELALAIATRRDHDSKNTTVCLIAGSAGLMEGHAQAVRRQVRAALEQRGVEVFETDAVAGPDGLALSGLGPVRFDAVIAATGRIAPRWLTETGLMRGPGGGVAIGADMRSVSHPSVWAAGDMSERLDRPLARSGVHAVKAGPILAANLRAVVLGGTLRRYEPRVRTLYLLATGERRAILSWGRLSLRGGWVWQLKNWIDCRFVVRYRRGPAARSDRSPIPRPEERRGF